jgi:hypothetical protein
MLTSINHQGAKTQMNGILLASEITETYVIYANLNINFASFASLLRTWRLNVFKQLVKH